MNEEVKLLKNSKKDNFFGGVGSGRGLGWGRRVGWVSVDVNGEVKFLLKFKKKNGGGGGGGQVWGGGGRVGGGQAGCERRSESFVKIKKNNIFLFGGGWGRVGGGRVWGSGWK